MADRVTGRQGREVEGVGDGKGPAGDDVRSDLDRSDADFEAVLAVRPGEHRRLAAAALGGHLNAPERSAASKQEAAHLGVLERAVDGRRQVDRPVPLVGVAGEQAAEGDRGRDDQAARGVGFGDQVGGRSPHPERVVAGMAG